MGDGVLIVLGVIDVLVDYRFLYSWKRCPFALCMLLGGCPLTNYSVSPVQDA